MTQNTALPGHGTGAPPGRTRIAALDVLRGVGLCGILVANVQLIAASDTAVDAQPLGAAQSWLGLPLFSLLFGVGFSLLMDSAPGRTPRPRLALLRRLLALLAVGLAHMLLWPGEILTVYAVVGLLVLLPSTWLPRWAVAGLAAVLLPAALVVAGGGPLVIAGFFLTGSALARYGAVDRIERSTWGPVLAGAACAAGAALALWADGGAPAGPTAARPPSVPFLLADLLQTGVYVCVLLVLLRTPLRPVLTAVFAPLGRMALTNYLTATLLVLFAARVLGLPVGESAEAALSVAGAVVAAQVVCSTLWLRRHRQGPAEWLWRWATWWKRPPLRAGADAG
ncbi:DUF418 domain-containing protein [Nocardiopsis aegyptia]|uniref:DUF418 domain-containing protein n=1 Tax=Nocardiopsis aegyptia TaxID=220378 RepID=UPI0036713261